MGATTQTTAELLGEMVELTLDHRCPICGAQLSANWELGCTFVPGLTNCRTLNRFREDDPSREQFARREKIVGALQLLLSARR